MAVPRLVVIDVDGTLAFKGRMDQTPGGPNTAGMDAVSALRDSTTFALVSGHSARNLRTFRDELGIDLMAAELGSVIVHNGREPRYTVEWNGNGPPAEHARRSGLVQRILDAHPELYDKGTPRTVTVPLKGKVDDDTVQAVQVLVRDAHPELALLDNGAGSGVRTLHLGPRGVGKPNGVRALQEHVGVGAGDTIVIGDSPQDASCHEVARRVYIVANGDAGDQLAANVVRTKAGYGPGVAEALEAEFGPLAPA